MDKNQIKDYALKHSTSHLMASAIKELYPDVKVTIGPPTAEGFYYDFDNLNISEQDFKKIEKKMRQIAEKNLPFEVREHPKEEAEKELKDEPFKLEILKDLDGKITFYTHGDFTDLCEGPHVDSTKEIRHFKLMKVAGAYWRGDSNNKMLTRVYGVVFKTEKELKDYLAFLEEAKKRDHKKLGKDLDLFTFSELVGPGLPLWTPRGTMLRQILDDFIWSMRKEKGYQKVAIPHITKKDLYEKSGHWSKFKDDLFHVKTRENHEFVMKPMNCPHHTQIFASRLRSYKDMPQRYSETTMVYRDEQSGELQGLSRVRSISQDDAHVFCTKEQVNDEINAIWDIIDKFYSSFGFPLQVRFSTHDPDNFDAYMGSKEAWSNAEAKILEVIKKRGVDYIEGVGEAAFYGPKIDFMAKDSLDREWQVATIQLDFNQPEGFNLNFTNEKGEKERAVMIHAAITGSLERFLSILIEHVAGNFPLWLSPEQIRVLTVNESNKEYAAKVYDALKREGFRVNLDSKSNSISKKVKESQLLKINYMLTIGDKEVENETISIRSRTGDVKFGVKLEDFIKQVRKKVDDKK